MTDRSPRCTCITRSGFTLVELLVVIGIIAVLISILLPSLNRAREQGKTAACGSNQRQIHNAFVMYSGENKQWIPGPCAALWANPNDRRFTSGGYQTAFVWSFQLGKYLGYKDLRPGMYDGQAANQRDPRPASVFHCPSVGPMMADAPYAVDQAFFENAYGNGYQALSGYGMNPWLPPKTTAPFLPGYNGITAFDGSTLIWDEIWQLKYAGAAKLGKVRKSSAVVLVADGSGINGMLGDTYEYNNFSPNSVDAVTHFATDYRRHNKRSGLNAVYVDGHVQFMDSKTAADLISKDRFPADNIWRGGNQFCFQEE